MQSQIPKALLFDLGDVLFKWSSHTTIAIPGKLMHDMLSSTTWSDYEYDLSEQDTCYQQLAQRFSVPAREIADAVAQASESLRPNSLMMSFIRRLKKNACGTLRVYGISNISREDYAFLLAKAPDWSVFDQVFSSGHVGLRKPDPEFYRHVLREIKLEPYEVIFVNDELENVLAAKVLGINGLVFEDDATIIQTLSKTLDKPVTSGREYLRNNDQCFGSVTQSGVVVPEHFAQLLVVNTLQDR